MFDDDDTDIVRSDDDAVGDVRFTRGNFVRELRERNAAELRALKAEIAVRADSTLRRA